MTPAEKRSAGKFNSKAARGIVRGAANRLMEASHDAVIWLFWPVNFLLAYYYRVRVDKRSVLHISYMVHIPPRIVQLLREAGWHADFLAIGTSPTWNKCDHQYLPNRRLSAYGALREWVWFWRVVAHYKIIHSHFMINLTHSGWEFHWLKFMGRKLVIHYRGCEIRDRQQLMRRYPTVNICQQCDYNAVACSNEVVMRRRKWSRRYGDLFLVTTPDMLQFVPDGVWLPFFTPDLPMPGDHHAGFSADRAFRVFHVTAHPGIEGSDQIRRAITNLRKKGYRIDLVFLQGVSYDEACRTCATCDMAIGKMKMGYYANAQIESMMLGVPTITSVRPELMRSELEESAFIFSDLDTLEDTLEFYMTHPDALAEKRAQARESILRLHDNRAILNRLCYLYNALIDGQQEPVKG